MPSATTFAAIKYSKATDEIKGFPGEVSEPGAKTIDKYLEEHTLYFKTRAGAYNGVSGEFALQNKAGESTMTLPAVATASQIIGVFSGAGATTKITTSGGAFIYGDFINKEATITLLPLQHVILFSDGGEWLIIAGEPKREQTYSAPVAYTKAEAEAGHEVSATRPGYVALTTATNLAIGGVALLAPGGGTPYYVPPGQKWKTTVATEAQTLLL